MHRCENEIGYVYQLDKYRGLKTTKELNLAEKFMLNVYKDLKNTYCFIYLENFFNSPMLINKFHDEGLYILWKVYSNREQK